MSGLNRGAVSERLLLDLRYLCNLCEKILGIWKRIDVRVKNKDRWMFEHPPVFDIQKSRLYKIG